MLQNWLHEGLADMKRLPSVWMCASVLIATIEGDDQDQRVAAALVIAQIQLAEKCIRSKRRQVSGSSSTVGRIRGKLLAEAREEAVAAVALAMRGAPKAGFLEGGQLGRAMASRGCGGVAC